MSTTYQPQTDGQTEALKRYLQQRLRAFYHEKPSSRGKHLNWGEFHYNMAQRSSAGLFRFQVVTGNHHQPFHHTYQGQQTTK